jgi:hypothetical protein
MIMVVSGHRNYCCSINVIIEKNFRIPLLPSSEFLEKFDEEDYPGHYSGPRDGLGL